MLHDMNRTDLTNKLEELLQAQNLLTILRVAGIQHQDQIAIVDRIKSEIIKSLST